MRVSSIFLIKSVFFLPQIMCNFFFLKLPKFYCFFFLVLDVRDVCIVIFLECEMEDEGMERKMNRNNGLGISQIGNP